MMKEMLKEAVKKFIPRFLIGWYHFLMAFLGALVYRFPSRKLKVIGITGTKGKTTTVELTKAIFEKAGYKTASISSIRFTLGDKEWRNELKMTMPGRMRIQKFLRQAIKNNCQYAVFEVTSEGILQHRHRFIDFKAVLFNNLSPEHLERHGGFEKYRQAKTKLFQVCRKIQLVNLDDENAEYFLQFPAKEKWGYRINLKGKAPSTELESKVQNLIQINEYQENTEGISFKISSLQFKLSLLGEFNIYNALAAISIVLSQGISLATCQKALAKVERIAGRMEEVIKEPFRAIVDYAHTPDSLEKVYRNISKFKNQNSKLICLLGSAGGGRDKWKRPTMGKIAVQYCDEIILTNEDPYDEEPLAIINQVAEGIAKRVMKILDRREAIKKALTIAKPDDIVIITGKGSECWICLEKGKKIPWSDKNIVLEEFKKL